MPNHQTITERSGERSGPAWRVAALAGVATVALSSCGTGAASTTSPAASPVPSMTGAVPTAMASVSIVDFNFTPATLTVKSGTTVVWTNNDSVAHNVAFMGGGETSKSLNPHDQFMHTFTAPGTYAYICSIHPFMRGTVTVTE